VPENIKALRRKVVERNGGRLDDVEFTFGSGGGSKTLGEATLKNRIKSHPDVGERWYPDILAEIRKKQQAETKELGRSAVENGTPVVGGLGKAVKAH
jgi:hypothetical protein